MLFRQAGQARRLPAPPLARVRVAPVVLALAAAMLMPAPRAASAADAAAAREYAIPAGSLRSVLDAFAAQSGALLSIDGEAIHSLRSSGLTGQHGIQAGLNQILRPHGLQAVPNAAGIFTFVPLPPAAGTRAAAQLAPVTVVGQNERESHDDAYRGAGTRNIITRDDIERFRGTTVGDIFQGTPGVLVAENRNSGGLDINIRGMQGQGRVPVLVDGARQETTVYRGYAGVVSRSYIDPDLIGGITIEKGPTMNAQGTGAIGGLVIMNTLRAIDIVRPGETLGIRVRGSLVGNNTGDPIAPNTRSGYAVGGFLGTDTYRIDCKVDCSRDALPAEMAPAEGMDKPGLLNMKGWAGSLAIAKRWDKVDLVAAYAERNQGNYYAGKHGPAPWVDLSDQTKRSFWTDVTPKLVGASRFRAGERIANTQYASRSFLLKSKFYLPLEQELELGFLRYASEYGEMMPSMLIRFGQVAQAPSSTVDARTWTARYAWNPTGNDWLDLRANLWRTDTQSRNVNYPEEHADVMPTLRDMMGTERYERWGLDFSNTMAFNAMGPLQWRYGVAWQFEDVQPDNPGEQGAGFVRDGERREFSAFTAVQWKPIASLTFDAGLRYSKFRANDRTPPFVPKPGDSQCIDNGSGGCTQLSVHHTAASGSTPIASLTWEPLAGLQFYGSYAEAMRMPSLFESTRGFSVGQAFDVAIRPEHAYNREFGINWMRDGLWTTNDKLRIKLAYFRNTVRDYLTRTSPNLWEESSQTADLFVLRNIQKASFHGYEASLDYDIGWLFMRAGGTRYTFIETCHDGSYRREQCTDYGIANSYINNMIPPKWHASLLLGTRLLDRRLTLGARATLMGQRTQQPRFNDDTRRGFLAVVPWHKYEVFDLFASYKVNDRLSVDFNIDNLTDRYYLDALGLGLVPAPGRTARLSMTMQF